MSETSRVGQRPVSRQTMRLALVAALCFALFLLASLPYEVTYLDGEPWYRQPYLWSLIAILGMLLAAAGDLALVSRYRQMVDATAGMEELRYFGGAVKLGAAFAVYVYAVQILGYLPSSILFALILVRLAGYRHRWYFYSAAGVAAGVVIIFKGMLSVKIPGGWLYDALPSTLRLLAKTYL